MESEQRASHTGEHSVPSIPLSVKIRGSWGGDRPKKKAPIEETKSIEVHSCEIIT